MDSFIAEMEALKGYYSKRACELLECFPSQSLHKFKCKICGNEGICDFKNKRRNQRHVCVCFLNAGLLLLKANEQSGLFACRVCRLKFEKPFPVISTELKCPMPGCFEIWHEKMRKMKKYAGILEAAAKFMGRTKVPYEDQTKFLLKERVDIKENLILKCFDYKCGICSAEIKPTDKFSEYKLGILVVPVCGACMK